MKTGAVDEMRASRGFAISGYFLGHRTQGGVLENSHLPWATIGHPYGVSFSGCAGWF